MYNIKNKNQVNFLTKNKMNHILFFKQLYNIGKIVNIVNTSSYQFTITLLQLYF
jgi:hypothetical protein